MKKSQWWILAAVVVLVGIYFLARSRQPVEKEIRFFSADSSEVAEIKLFTQEDTLVVKKIGNAWKMTYPLTWDVNQQQLASFFQKVLPAKTSATPMSEDPNLQSMYKVDSLSACQIVLCDKKGRILDHAYIGNGTNTAFIYGRRQGENQIYQFKEDIINLVTPDVMQWRSPNIINLKQSQIKSIEVRYPQNTYTLTFSADSTKYSDARESFIIPASNRAQYKIINALENLMTWQFIDTGTEKYANDFKHPACTIRVNLNNGQTVTLTLAEHKQAAKETTDKNSFPEQPLIFLKLNDQSAPLYQMTADFLNRFTRDAAHFKTQYE